MATAHSMAQRPTREMDARQQRMDRTAWRYGTAVLVTALVIRLCFLWGTPDRRWPHGVLYEGDAPLYVRWAAAIRAVKPFEFDLPIHSPGTAFLYSIFGVAPGMDFLPLKIGLCVIGSLSCLLAWRLAYPLVGRGVALAAGLLSAASFGLLVQCTTLNNETLYTFLLLVILAMLLRLADRPALYLAVLLGVVHALAALLRAEHILFFLLSLPYLAVRWMAHSSFRNQRSASGERTVSVPYRLCFLFAMSAVFILVPLPWTIRSFRAIQEFNTVGSEPVRFEAAEVPWTPQAIEYLQRLPAFARSPNFRFVTFLAIDARQTVVDEAFVRDFFDQMGYVPRALSRYTFISNQGALSFALANNDLADGGFSTLLLDAGSGRSAPGGQVSVSDFAFANPRHLRLFQEGYRIGWDYLRANPRAAAKLMWNKLTIFVAGLASGFTAWNAPLGGTGLRRPVDQFVVTWDTIASRPGLVLAWRLFIVVLIAAGLAESVKRRTAGLLILVIVYKLLLNLAFYGYTRQAVSILPVTYIFVALGLVRMLPRRQRILGLLDGRLGSAVVAATAVLLIASGVASGVRGWEYQVYGSGDPAPEWGPRAFESHQSIEVHRVTPSQPLSTGFRVG